jgi:hypothetical protein
MKQNKPEIVPEKNEVRFNGALNKKELKHAQLTAKTSFPELVQIAQTMISRNVSYKIAVQQLNARKGK